MFTADGQLPVDRSGGAAATAAPTAGVRVLRAGGVWGVFGGGDPATSAVRPPAGIRREITPKCGAERTDLEEAPRMLVESSDGVRIGYEVHGQGQPLVLLHGFFGDRGTWHAAGYVEALAEQARLILVDARGHGESDAPTDSASYRVSQQVADIVAVLDALSIERTAFWGSSMGGTIGLHLLATNPNRITAVITTGAHAETVRPAQEDIDHEAELFRTQGVAPFIDHLERQGVLPDWMRTAMLTANPHALAALTVGLVERDSILGALAQCHAPVLMLAGEHDPRLSRIRQTAQRLARAVTVELPGCGHFDAFVRSDLSIPPARTLLATASS